MSRARSSPAGRARGNSGEASANGNNENSSWSSKDKQFKDGINALHPETESDSSNLDSVTKELA